MWGVGATVGDLFPCDKYDTLAVDPNTMDEQERVCLFAFVLSISRIAYVYHVKYLFRTDIRNYQKKN